MKLSVKNKIKIILIVTGVTAVIYLIIKYCLPLVTPFIFAFITALIIVKPVDFLEKIHINRNIGTIIMMLAFYGICIYIIYKLGGAITGQLKELTKNLGIYANRLECVFMDCCSAIDRRFDLNTGSSVRFVNKHMENAANGLTEGITGIIMNGSTILVSGFAKFFTAFAFMIMAVFFFCRDINKVWKTAQKQGFYKELAFVWGRIKTVFGTYIKTQLVIMLLTTIICVTGLYFMGNHYALLLGILIGIMDALPVLGTGTAFIPWIVVKIFLKDYSQAVALLVIYLVCYYMRQILEPKMMGKNLGVAPVWMLVSLYIGLKLFGVSGVITGPIAFVFIKELSGVLVKRLVKTEKKLYN